MGESLVESLLEKLLLGITLSKAEHAQLFNSVYEYCRKCIIESGQIGYELLMRLKRLLEKRVESLKNVSFISLSVKKFQYIHSCCYLSYE